VAPTGDHGRQLTRRPQTISLLAAPRKARRRQWRTPLAVTRRRTIEELLRGLHSHLIGWFGKRIPWTESTRWISRRDGSRDRSKPARPLRHEPRRSEGLRHGDQRRRRRNRDAFYGRQAHLFHGAIADAARHAEFGRKGFPPKALQSSGDSSSAQTLVDARSMPGPTKHAILVLSQHQSIGYARDVG
jgi:hypothetical protein